MRSAFRGKGIGSELIMEVAWILYMGYDPNTMGREKRSRRARRDSWMLPKYYSPYLSQRPDFKKIALKDVRRTLEEDPPTENQNVP